MTNSKVIGFLELCKTLKNIETGNQFFLVTTEVDPNILVDLINKITQQNKGQSTIFKINNNCSPQKNKHLFKQSFYNVITEAESIGQFLKEPIKSAWQKSLIIATKELPNELKSQLLKDFCNYELQNTLTIDQSSEILVYSGAFTEQKASIIGKTIKHSLAKKTVTIVDLLNIFNTMSLVHSKDTELFVPTLRFILSQEELFFTLPKLLFTNPQEFIVLWQKTKPLFPMHFWTIFWGNFFTKAFVFKSFEVKNGFQLEIELTKSISKLSQTKLFQSLSPQTLADTVNRLFKLDWMIKNTTNDQQIDPILLSIILFESN